MWDTFGSDSGSHDNLPDAGYVSVLLKQNYSEEFWYKQSKLKKKADFMKEISFLFVFKNLLYLQIVKNWIHYR